MVLPTALKISRHSLYGVLGLWGLATISWLLARNRPVAPDRTGSGSTPPDLVSAADRSVGAKAAVSGQSQNATESITDQLLSMLSSGDPGAADKVWPLLKAWAHRDPRAAAAFAQSEKAAKWRADAMVTVAQAWTEVNVDDAEAWASQLSNPTERNMTLGYVAFEEANLDPKRAVQVMANEPLSDDRQTIIVQNLANQWTSQASDDLQFLYNWVATLPASQHRDDLYERVAIAQSFTAPAQAGLVVVNNIAPGPIQDDATIQILRQWARQDMSAAIEWASQLPTEALREKAEQALSGNSAGAYLPY